MANDQTLIDQMQGKKKYHTFNPLNIIVTNQSGQALVSGWHEPAIFESLHNKHPSGNSLYNPLLEAMHVHTLEYIQYYIAIL